MLFQKETSATDEKRVDAGSLQEASFRFGDQEEVIWGLVFFVDPCCL